MGILPVLLTGHVPLGKPLQSMGFSFLICEMGFLSIKHLTCRGGSASSCCENHIRSRMQPGLQKELIGLKKKIELRFYLKISSERKVPMAYCSAHSLSFCFTNEWERIWDTVQSRGAW